MQKKCYKVTGILNPLFTPKAAAIWTTDLLNMQQVADVVVAKCANDVVMNILSADSAKRERMYLNAFHQYAENLIESLDVGTGVTVADGIRVECSLADSPII